MTDKQLMQDAYDALCVVFPGQLVMAEWVQNKTLRAALRERLAQLASGQEPVGERKASEVWIESESFKAKAPLKDGGVSNRFSFNCSGGCGECGVKVIEFVSYSKQGDEDERWVTIASEPQLISTCCGSPVEIYDDLIRDFCAAVEAVSYTPAPSTTEVEPMNSKHLNVASQCRATASSPMSTQFMVDGGTGTLRELLTDAADAIELECAATTKMEAQIANN
jgi:hypothetical protein